MAFHLTHNDLGRSTHLGRKGVDTSIIFRPALHDMPDDPFRQTSSSSSSTGSPRLTSSKTFRYYLLILSSRSGLMVVWMSIAAGS